MVATYSPEVKAAVTEDTARHWAINGSEEYRRKALSLIRRKQEKFVNEVIFEGRGRCQGVEAGIRENPYWSCIYAKEVIRGRFQEAEPHIALDPVNSCKYAEEILRGEFTLAEPAIAANAAAAVRYATFLRRRFPSGEPVVFQEYKHTDEYFRVVVRTPDEDLERGLMTFPRAAVQYAELIRRGRWQEAEVVIQQDLSCLLDYARQVIRGQLPEGLHEYLVTSGVDATNKEIVRQYLDFCKYSLFQSVPGGSASSWLDQPFSERIK
jgi:hypothetical protein